MKFGIIKDEPITDYHGSPCVSHSKLESFINPSGWGPRWRPAVYHARYIAKTMPGPASESIDLGKFAHAMILEGDAVIKRHFAISPFDNFLKKEAREWRDAQLKAGLTVVRKEDADKEAGTICNMRDGILRNPDAAFLLGKDIGAQEVTFRKQMKHFAIQCRADQWISRGVEWTLPTDPERKFTRAMVDVKSCASIEQFVRSFSDRGYHRTAAFYREVEREVLAEARGMKLDDLPYADYLFVAIETQAPFDCMVYEMDSETVDAAQREVILDLRKLRECFETGNWLNPCRGLHKLKLRDYQIRQSLETTSELQ